MKANEIPNHQPVRLPTAFMKWWLSEPASEPRQAQSLSKSGPARRCVNENQLPESSRKIASVP
ncbi:hypothetical protein [Streptacidiphilus pinicola]|uniref:hypothetical protein n=1 Tax=Streptacidiphilus pinicola TaxID=2219663 RepID=UPI001403521F